MADKEAPATHAPRRRRRGFGIALLVVLIVLVGLLVAADRIGAGMAENRLVSVVEAEEAKRNIKASSTEVDIEGFPFLTQVARGRYDRIAINITDLKSGDLAVHSLRIDADDVTAKAGDLMSGNPKATAATVNGVATIAWDQLPAMLDYAGMNFGDATFAPAGESVRVSGTVKLNDQVIPVAATATFSVVSNQIKVKISDATISGMQVPPEAEDYVNQLQDKLSVGYKLPALPFGLKVQKVAATDAGLAVTATAKNVPLAQ